MMRCSTASSGVQRSDRICIGKATNQATYHPQIAEVKSAYVYMRIQGGPTTSITPNILLIFRDIFDVDELYELKIISKET